LTVSEILLLSAAAGLGEEVLFRGLIQSWLGFWLTSLLFGLIHALTPAYFVLGTLFGMAFGWLALATGNLLAPICAHAVYDAVAFYRYRQRLREEGGAGSAEEAATAAEAAGGSASGSDSASASASASDSASDSDSASAPASDPDPPVASKP
jgi:hypothetical protein